MRTICPSEIEPRIDAASVTAQPLHLPHAYFLINSVHDEDHGHDGDLRRDVRTAAQELAPCRLSARVQAGGGDRDSDPVGAPEWA